MKKPNSPKKTLKKLHDKAWELWSKIVRIKAKGVCFTCGIQNDWKECNAGHFRHGKRDFDSMNVNCQCVTCNKWKHGNLGIYAVNLIKKYGQEAVDDLILRSNQVDKYTIGDYELMIEKFKSELAELEG
jgi:hypothetical protein